MILRAHSVLRALLDNRIVYLIPSNSDLIPTLPISPNPSSSDGNVQQESEFNLLIFAAHCLGDGTGLHQLAHGFLTPLGGESSIQDLEEMLNKEWTERWGPQAVASDILPCSIEESMPQFAGRFRHAVATITIIPTVSFDEDRTKVMLKVCKAHRVFTRVHPRPDNVAQGK